MNTIDDKSGEVKWDVTLTFAADYWMSSFDDDKSILRKKRIEKILSNLDDKERTKGTIL